MRMKTSKANFTVCVCVRYINILFRTLGLLQNVISGKPQIRNAVNKIFSYFKKRSIKKYFKVRIMDYMNMLSFSSLK